MRISPAKRRALDRAREQRTDLGRNHEGANNIGNTHLESMTIDLPHDFAVFDALPKCVRDVLNHTCGKYAAIEALETIEGARIHYGWSSEQSAKAIKRLDAKNFPQEYSE